MRKYKYLLSVALLAGYMQLPAQVVRQEGKSLKLSLNDAITLALDKNLSVKIADAEVERVDYLKKENMLALIPTMNATGQYINNVYKPVLYASFLPGGKMEMGSTHAYSAGISFQLPIISFPVYKNIQMSQLEMEAALHEARATREDLLAQVKNAFYGALVMKESLDVLEKSYGNALKSANNVNEMFRNGLASEYDKIRADVAARNILPQVTQARNAVEFTMMQLKVLLSVNLKTPVELVGTLEDYASFVAPEPGREQYDIKKSNSYVSMDFQLRKLHKSFEMIRAQRLPSLLGVANYQSQMQNEQFRFDKPWSNALSVGVMIQIPILSHFSIGMKEKQMRANIKKLEYQRELLGNNLSLGIENQLNEMRRAAVQMQSDKEAVKQAEKGYEIAKVRYNTGAGTILELNDTEIALTRSRLNLNQTIYSFLKALIEYEKILGADSGKKEYGDIK